MSDEVTTETVAPRRTKAPKKNFYRDKADKLAAENARLKEQLEKAIDAQDQVPPDEQVSEAVKDHFKGETVITGFKDEYDRATEKHRDMVEHAKVHGLDPEEIIEYQLDRSEVRPMGYKGKQWFKENRL